MRQELTAQPLPRSAWIESIATLLSQRTTALFLAFWFVFGLIINVHNLRAYRLQQVGVDAIVTYGTFTLGYSGSPELQPGGDTFVLNNRTYAAKQPGQFVFGAIPYVALSAVGITYERDYDLAAALVTWLSAGLVAALALAFLDRLLWRLWRFDRSASAYATLSVGLGSTWLAYAGIAHHDVIAASLIVFALYAMERNRLQHAGQDTRVALAAGTLLGLAIFVSMLPALIVLTLGAFVATSKQRTWRSALWHGLGFLIGILPLLLYNGWYFGSPWLPANIAGNFSDTFPTFYPEQHLHHLNAYLGNGGISFWKYAPALALGVLGLFLLPRRLASRRPVLLAAVTLHLLYLLSIETTGTCQYGPRYLLPVMPLLAPGVAALVDARCWTMQVPVKWMVAGALLVYAFFVNLVGAVQNTIYCNLDQFAFWEMMGHARELSLDQFPLFGGVIVLLIAWVSFILTRVSRGL